VEDFIRKLKFVSFKSGKLCSYFEPLLEKACITVTPEEYISFFFNLLFLTFSAVLAAYLLLHNFILLSIIPIVLFIPIILPRIIIGLRKRSIESEFPFSLILSYISSFRSVFPVEYSIEILSKVSKKDFPALSREFLILERTTAYSPRSRMDIVEETLGKTPSRLFSTFITNYMTTLRSGGDVSSFLYNEASRAVKSLLNRWNTFVTNSTTLLEASFILLSILPIGLGMLYSSFPVSPMVYLSILFFSLALTCLSVLSVCEIAQPKLRDTKFPLYPLLVLIFLFSLLEYLSAIGKISITILGLCSLVSSSVYFFFSRNFFSKIIKSEEEAALLLHEISEYIKAGKHPISSLMNTLRNAKYKEIYQPLTTFVNLLLSGSRPVNSVTQIKASSWLVRYSFLLIALSVETGAGYEQMEKVSLLFKEIVDSKKQVSVSSIPFLVVGCAIPPISLFASWFLSGLNSNFSLLQFQFSPNVYVISVYATSFATALILSKFYSLSSRSMYPLPFILLSTFLASVIVGIL
jgi:hypothetical protein